MYNIHSTVQLQSTDIWEENTSPMPAGYNIIIKVFKEVFYKILIKDFKPKISDIVMMKL